MKKISIITLHAVHNYGSALQAYATQRIFEELGLDAQIIDYRRKAILPETIPSILRSSEYSLVQKAKLILIKPSTNKSQKVFERFLQKNLSMTAQRYTYDEDFLKNPIKADIFCTGSDQVWNSDWHDEIPKPFYLSFVPDAVPKIAFSASFGKSELADWEKEKTKELLSRYKAISVREKSGVTILQNLGIEDAELVLDPTQIAAPQLWFNLAPAQKRVKPYVLIYQLCNNRAFDRAAVSFSKEKGLELVRLCTRYDQLRKPGKGVVLPEVEEFLPLIRDAEYVLTDSFHCTSFSLIFHKKFVCFHPNRFSTRLESILQIVGLGERMMNDDIDAEIIDRPIDYSVVDQILDAQRQKGLEFLRKAVLDAPT